MHVQNKFRILPVSLTAALLTAAMFTPASADTVSGTLTFQGDVVFAAPIAGIDYTDMTVSSGPTIDNTGNGEHCAFTAPGSTPADALGHYASLVVGVSVTKNGNGQAPDGGCIVELQANGNDGASTSAHGTVTVEVTMLDIQGNATIPADEILVRQSKVQAGLTKDCLKYVKKQVKLRGKCNASLWKLGATDGALKCKSEIEPLACDDGNYAEAALALSFGDMDQQTNPPAAQMIDTDTLADQAKCQRYIGKAASGFFSKRNQLVQKNCVLALNDTEACRNTQTSDARAKLSLIDNCVGDRGTDLMTGLVIPDVAEPCLSEAVAGITLDRKALKDCFEIELSTLSDVLVGDVPVCGNGVTQSGEACDDGNNTNGDCCSSVCGNEPAGSQMCGVGACQVTVAQCSLGEPVTCTPGPAGTEAGNCADAIDNDCDGLTDAADTIDCP